MLLILSNGCYWQFWPDWWSVGQAVHLQPVSVRQLNTETVIYGYFSAFRWQESWSYLCMKGWEDRMEERTRFYQRSSQKIMFPLSLPHWFLFLHYWRIWPGVLQEGKVHRSSLEAVSEAGWQSWCIWMRQIIMWWSCVEWVRRLLQFSEHRWQRQSLRWKLSAWGWCIMQHYCRVWSHRSLPQSLRQELVWIRRHFRLQGFHN